MTSLLGLATGALRTDRRAAEGDERLEIPVTCLRRLRRAMERS